MDGAAKAGHFPAKALPKAQLHRGSIPDSGAAEHGSAASANHPTTSIAATAFRRKRQRCATLLCKFLQHSNTAVEDKHCCGCCRAESEGKSNAWWPRHGPLCEARLWFVKDSDWEDEVRLMDLACERMRVQVGIRCPHLCKCTKSHPGCCCHKGQCGRHLNNLGKHYCPDCAWHMESDSSEGEP